MLSNKQHSSNQVWLRPAFNECGLSYSCTDNNQPLSGKDAQTGFKKRLKEAKLWY